MNKLVYVHGTNGSGKSTLARALIAHAGGVKELRKEKTGWTTRTNQGIVLLGKYNGRQCGGVDCIAPYSEVPELMLRHAIFPEAKLFAEGLITPGLDTCKKMESYFERAVFICLDIPEADCIAHMVKRKARIGRHEPYNPANLYRKANSARNWCARLQDAGLIAYRLNYENALARILHEFKLEPLTLEGYLS